jgi:hypothetical protein
VNERFARRQRVETPVAAFASAPIAGKAAPVARLPIRAPRLDMERKAITLRGTDLEAQIARFMDRAAEAGYECSLMFHEILEHRVLGEFGRGEIVDALSKEKRAGADGYFMRCGPGRNDFVVQRLVIFTDDHALIRLAEEAGGTVAL